MKAPDEAELVTLIGLDGVIRLAEEYGGTRLYVPSNGTPDHRLFVVLGKPAFDALCGRFAPDVIQVPLFREQRAMHYRANGKSMAAIARMLGITETGVEKLFVRVGKGDAEC